jgi:Type IV secretion system pilin/Amyloid A4 N-terminal heparin-binding/IPT/TIG domain
MSNKFKSLLVLTLILGSFFLIVPQSFAAVNAGVNEVSNSIALGNTSPIKTATNVINILMGLLSLIAISLILWGGFTYMTSGGSEEKIDQAKKILKNATIGLVIVLSAWGITYFILSKLVGDTGGASTGPDNCTSGASTSCGCGGAQTCNSGVWGPCLGSTCNPIIDSKTSCDGKTAVAECQADNNLCGTDYTCDANDCLCKPKASLGDSCNTNAAGGTCKADDNLCGPYLKCDPDACVCVGPPVITGISPAGGFCNNDANRGCNLDSDCLAGAKCDTATPNGAANNFITIYGYNFGTSSNAFESFLTNIDFEKGAVGSVPTDWSSAAQKHSNVGIVNNVFKSGKQSVRIHQDANQEWPGICNKATCDDMDGCVWKIANNTCNFPNTDGAHSTAPAVYNQGETLVWGNSHNVMWSKLTYNLAPLNFKIGDTYSIQFYYKGKTASTVNVQVAPDLGWASMCAGYDYYASLKSGYTWDGSKVNPTPANGEDPCAFGKTCSDQANTCCVQAPYQKKCYGSLNLTSIAAGDVSDWTLYSYTFQYTPEMNTWLNSVGGKMIELGMSIGYNSTGAGTDLFIDDFTVTKVLNTGQITFLGANAGQSQLANFPKLLNPNCISSWTDRQITVAVPTGAATGPVQIKREGGLADNIDTTNNDSGPKIPDFIKNDIYRPSLCQISPIQGSLGAKVDYQGVNLKNSTAYFGEYTNSYKGINSVFATDNLSGQTLAPSIVPGQTTTFVERALSGINQKSNALVFVKEKEAEAGPYISSFYPTSGAAGQYVTITGSGFGNLRGSRQVLFGDKEASYAFPDVCSNAVWSDSQVIVKVPDGLTASDYGISLDLGDVTINTDLLSPNNTFKFDPTQTLKTSLCKIDPIRGQIGDKVSLWGEYFGNTGTNASVVFSRAISTSSKIIKDGVADKIETVVPISNTGVAAITGPVHVLKNGEWGNELNFTVGKCTSNSECNASSPTCCPANTFKTGSCAASLLSCYFDVPNSVYETKFNTTLSSKDSNTTFDSCIGMANFFGACQTGQFCPNSPGKCSPFIPNSSQAIPIGSCGSATSECGGFSSCNITELNTPKVAFWGGKVNQHFDLAAKSWTTDSDGSSGSGVDKLTYCKKFYPDTTNVIEYKTETISSWKSAGNVGSSIFTVMTYRCVLAGETNTSKCLYNKSSDSCQAKKCILEKEYQYSLSSLNNDVDTKNYKGSLSCRAYLNKVDGKTTNVKQLKVTTSCPDGWSSVGNGYCVNLVPVLCNPCDSEFKCTEDSNKTDDFGICESTKICASSATCEKDGDNKYSCFKADQAKCDCCCSIDDNKPNGTNPGCCAPLKCAGTCGSGAGYGSCSGCAAVGSTIADHDNACNCDTTSGKFCDTSKSDGGACVDCAALDETGCSAHAEQCCFNSGKNVCQGGNGTLLGGKCAFYDCDATNKTTCNQTPSLTGQFLATSVCETSCAKDSKTACDLAGADAAACSNQINCCFDGKNKICKDATADTGKIKLNNINYCAYYNCNDSSHSCSGVASTTGEIMGLDVCEKNCKATTNLPGFTCASQTVGACNSSFCGNPYNCLSASTSGPTTSDCGVCCCKPGDKNGDLTCLADKGSCTGGSRGLFCGCSIDNQCGDSAQGCGSDTCCHGRPSVIATEPKNEDQNVCRNRQIEVSFDQEMNAQTLASNILLLEEKTYGTDVCPDGTTLSFNNFKPKETNLLARLFEVITNSFRKIFSGGSENSALAAGPSPDKLYCISPITIEAQTSYLNGATTTKAYIQPQKLLAAKANYFVVVKGDENLDSNSGVVSIDKIGLNGSTASPIFSNFNSSSDYGKANMAAFNGVGFDNSYTFGFTTMDDGSGKNGLCTISSVGIKPSSFLIKTAENDTSDDDPSNIATFDKKSDNDRAAYSYAYSSDGQLLQSVPGYAWNWKWSINDNSVAHKLNITNLKANQIVLGAVSGVTDKSTKVTATIDMTNLANASFIGNNVSGSAELYVFLCANPWPNEINGTWNPWVDKCTDGAGNQISGCINYNYKFYYCRDAGQPGTADDLPAVIDPALILGSSGNLICSTDGSSCATAGASCGIGGTCIWNVLKESYFFREAIPQSGEVTEIRSTGAGEQVVLSWYSPVDTFTSFKIYYGLISGKSSSYITSLSLAEANCNKKDGKIYCSYLVNGLNNAEKYTFKVSALTDKKVESLLSGGKDVLVTDTTAPAIPIWYNDRNTPRVMFWSSKVNQHFDLTTGSWATDPGGRSGAGIDKLEYCKKFYPDTVAIEPHKTETITTWRSAGNEGSFTNTLMSYRCIPSKANIGSNILGDKLILSWAANTDDTLYYRLFHGLFAGKKAADSVDSPNNTTSLTFNLSDYRAGDHYFYLAAIDKSGNISLTSNEIKVIVPVK